MGILEVHFHDPEFDFSPSMTTGGEPGDESDAESDDGGDVVDDWETDDAGGVGVGALVALVFLVAVAVLAGLKRRSGDESADEAEVELEA